MFGWQIEKLFVVVERTSIFVGQERDVAIARVLVAKKCRYTGKKKQGDWFSINVNSCGSEVGVGKVIDCDRFSSLNKLVRVARFVLRYVHNLKAF